MGYHCPPLRGIFYWGWAGVDLFFVLSGFLVSGLLFNEHKKHNEINPTLFLIRRGFKIYPAFYCYILAMITISYLNTVIFNNPSQFELNRFFAEIFFVQNYYQGLQPQTWSLGIEEHFYIFLTIVLFIAFKYRWVNLRSITTIFLILFLVAIASRSINYSNEFNHFQSFYPTHLRMDALFFGVLISYLFNYYQESFIKNVRSYKFILLPISLTCISPIFLFTEQHYLMNIFGLPLLYFGFGLLLIIAITALNIDKEITRLISIRLYNIIAYLGIYSYSIYLWHLGIPQILIKIIDKFLPGSVNNLTYVIIYIFTAVSIGITMGKLIEIPFLKIRDRYFPKKSNKIKVVI